MNFIIKLKNKIIFFALLLVPLVSQATGINKAKTNLDAARGTYNPDATIYGVVGTIITLLLSIVGTVFLILMIYGGYLWMIDRGNEETVKKAQNLIKASIIGLIIVVSAYAISYLLVSQFVSPEADPYADYNDLDGVVG